MLTPSAADWRSLSAASIARLSPIASPVPIIALPISLITERTSAKSRLIRPGMTIRSVSRGRPAADFVRHHERLLEVVFGLAMRNRFWLGMTISVSTCCCVHRSRLQPNARDAPFETERLVTTPTVRYRGRARLGVTGAPRFRAAAHSAAMKHIWAPSSACSISTIASSAAALPISGRDPRRGPGDLGTKLNLAIGLRMMSAWDIGVGDDEIDAPGHRLNHLAMAFPPARQRRSR